MAEELSATDPVLLNALIPSDCLRLFAALCWDVLTVRAAADGGGGRSSSSFDFGFSCDTGGDSGNGSGSNGSSSGYNNGFDTSVHRSRSLWAVSETPAVLTLGSLLAMTKLLSSRDFDGREGTGVPVSMLLSVAFLSPSELFPTKSVKSNIFDHYAVHDISVLNCF